MAKRITREDAEYEQMFGKIPNDQLGRIAYILGSKVDNERLQKEIEKKARELKRIRHKECSFTMWKIVKPSARPRHTDRGGFIQTYVPRAKENGNWFEGFFDGTDLPIISTPCAIDIDIYEKTPSSFRMRDAVLAEMQLIRPCKRTGDVDNYAKTILDMIQHGMLAEDALVYKTEINRYYSVKPHADVRIRYLEKWPNLQEHVTGRLKIKPLGGKHGVHHR